MANNNKGRTRFQTFSINSARRTPENRAPKHGYGKGVDGIDRSKIDALALEKEIARLAGDVWDE